MSDGFTCFVCDNCHTEIEASPDLIGQETECPACGRLLVIPDNREDDGIQRHSAESTNDKIAQAMKSRTIRIDLGDF